MADDRTDPQYKLRFTQDLRDLVAASAEASNRSMNAEIIERLEIAYGLKDDLSDRSVRRSSNVGGILLAAEIINELLIHFKCDTKDLPDHLALMIDHVKYMRDLVAHGKQVADKAHKRAKYYRKSVEMVDTKNLISNMHRDPQRPRAALRTVVRDGSQDDPEGAF